ncbi:unnamed protein product [Adineta ricciae]|uniref:Uncharacterized protein n=1 Tax=Adineta ricciae TaxID=249248 RepID=A0A813S723_ADIRI|nr:unnamed protein product [Adineta ricciae]CAF0792005.1 unnamed protein product [Adineta ricciae]
MLSSSITFYLSLLLCCSVFFLTVVGEVNRPTVGVIRWDAWNMINGQYDYISNRSRNWFIPQQYHYRLPFFAQILSENNITLNEDTQEVMDQEILYAKLAGFDYWAFDTYCAYSSNCTSNSSFCNEYIHDIAPDYCVYNPAYGLNRYLSSQYVSFINFTLLLLGSTICDSDLQDYYIDLMARPQYQTVLDGRPLVYLFQFSDKQAQFCGGNWTGSKQVVDGFRQRCTQRGIFCYIDHNDETTSRLFLIMLGLKDPYMVYMSQNILEAKKNGQALGFNAISSYGVNGGGTNQGAPFSDKVQQNEQWWNAVVGSGAKVVIPLSTGWDTRPQTRNGTAPYYLQPSDEELQSFMRSAIKITCENRNVTEANTVLVYAWNECAENGAALIPSLGNGTYFVNALSKTLPMFC